MEGDEIIDLVGRLAKTKIVLSHSDVKSVHVLARAIQDISMDRWTAMIKARPRKNAMTVCMVDGWSTFIPETFTAKLNGKAIVRVGRHRHEFLLSRRFLKMEKEADHLDGFSYGNIIPGNINFSVSSN